MSHSLNGDLSVRASVDTNDMDWAPSPSGTVWRKRVHLVGPPESGQVTSLVRYEPGSSFPTHDHPEGEEILVLEGVFSDEHGDWPAGTYLLNPEGFRHRPFSRPGCRLLVKLRQFPGTGRRHLAVDTGALAWQPTPVDGVAAKPLYEQDGFSDAMRLERWDPGADAGIVTHALGAELFVLEGELADDSGRFPAGCWLRLPAGGSHHPRSTRGCTLYVKTGGLAYLRSVGVRSATGGGSPAGRGGRP
jgi:anti-sigma factor ChrR (cupin superfamily)